MTRNKKVTRRWEVFPGRNKFYCNGFLMTAPNTTVFCLTVFLITGTSGLFFAFDCPFLAQTITPAIPIVGGILYVFVMIALFRTSFSDPGVIPRASAEEAAEIEKQIEVPNSLNSPTYRPPPRVKEVYVKGQVVKLKYCFTCKIFRPPRASHCSLCDNCVERFDHHCPWVGNCVGKRNYRFFYMFIVSLAFLAVFIFSCAMTHIILLTKANEPVVTVIKETPTSVIVATICFFSVWSVIGLAGFHTYLTSSDQTTNEDIKGSFSSKNGQQSVNPYSHGNICLNCFHILCGPISPSLINRRGIVTDDERLQIEYDSKYAAQQAPRLVQPLSSNKFGIPAVGAGIVGSDMNKPYSNPPEIDQSLNNTGVYRQRSYDNLQNNGKFNNNSSFKIKKSASGFDVVGASTSMKALSPPAITATIQTATTNTQTMLSPINNNNMIQSSPMPGTLPLNYSYYTPQTSYNSASANANLSSGSGTDTDGGGSSSGNVITSQNQHQRRHSSNYPLTTLPRYLYQKNRGMPFVGQCTTNNESYRPSSRNSSSSSAKIYAHKNSAYSDRDFEEYENTLYHNNNNNNNNEIVATHFQRGSECEPMLRNSKKYHYNSNNHGASVQSNSSNSKKGYRRDSGTLVSKYPNSPYVSRKRHHRHSNVYDYRTTLNYDLNAINEDGVNET